MLIYFVFPDDFDGALDIRLAMKSYTNLTKATLSENPSYFISIFNIYDLFEATEVLESEDTRVSLVTVHGSVLC